MAEAKKKEPTKVKAKAEPEPKPEPKVDPMKQLVEDLADLAPRLDEAVRNQASDRMRAALLRIHSAVVALPDALQTESQLER